MITQAQARKDCVWVFTDGSVHDDLSGAAAIFADDHDPFGATSLRLPLGPFQSSTDAELVGIRGLYCTYYTLKLGAALSLSLTHRQPYE